MKVLVTGAEGLLGNNLTRHLLENGFSVRALVDADLWAPNLDGLDVERATGSLLDMESTVSSLDGIQAVFNCAVTNDTLPSSTQGPASNFTGTRNLLIAMSRAGVGSLVHVGSALCFDPGSLDEPATENSPYEGSVPGLRCLDTIYAAQEMVLRYNRTGKVSAVVVNPTFSMGRYDSPRGLCASLIGSVERGLRLVPPGGLNVVGAQSVARATLKALGRGKPGSCYILGGNNTGYGRLLRLIAESLGVRPPSLRPPGIMFRMLGRIGFPRGRLTATRQLSRPGLSRMLTRGLYYSSQRAEAELALETEDLQAVVESACNWYEEATPRER